MEKTITLSLEEYNQLLKYKDVFDNKKTVYINMFDKNITSYTENEAIERLLKELEEVEKENEKIFEKSIELQLENKKICELYKQLQMEAKVLSYDIEKFKKIPWYKRISYKFQNIL